MRSLHVGLVSLGICLGAGLAGGGYFVGQTLYNGRVAVNTTEVKGLAERIVMADQADWTVGFNVASGDEKELPQLYHKADIIQKTIKKILMQEGFSEDEIKLGVIDYRYREFRDKQNNLISCKHILSSNVSLVTEKVDMVSAARSKVSMLITKGISISNQKPKYRFTKLNDIKPDMLQEAAKNARVAANEFAKNAGGKVGKIRSARQGGFIIRDYGENYGDTAKVKKTVRVVTTIDFYLTD